MKTITVILLADCPTVGTTEAFGGPRDGEPLVYMEGGNGERVALEPEHAAKLARLLQSACRYLKRRAKDK